MRQLYLIDKFQKAYQIESYLIYLETLYLSTEVSQFLNKANHAGYAG